MLRLKVLMASSFVVCTLACGGSEEEALLNRFFSACRAGDNATVSSVSLVGFPGECESWEVVQVSEAKTEPFRLPELRDKVDEAKKVRDVQFEKGKYFLEDNYNSIERIQLQLEKDPNAKFTGKLGETHQEWQRIIEERKSLERNVGDINRELERETRLVKMSLMEGVKMDNLDGQSITSEIQINVTAGGQTKPYTVVLRRYNLTDKESNVTPPSRWIIMSIQESAT